MKILWITNQPTPDIGAAMGLHVGYGGGWMTSMSKQLSRDHILSIAFPVPNSIAQTKKDVVCGISAFGIPTKKNAAIVDNQLVQSFRDVISEVSPDVIHIWGTEYVHTYCAMLAIYDLGLSDRTVVSIQGLVSVYANHFWGYARSPLEYESIFSRIVSSNSLYRQYKSFINRGKFERLTISLAKHVIGRTDWDKACVEQINSNAVYHHCNETLREAFYSDRWDYESCIKYSIFMSQGNYPLKGFHLALKALPEIIKKYPKTCLYITGRDCTYSKLGFRSGLSTYERYIRKLIKSYNLQEHVVFLGNLDEQEMKRQFLRCNVFLSASSIENSPNSVGEAMLLGVPTVSSDVGGVKNLFTHEREGFIYPADEHYMISFYINKLFEDLAICEKFSSAAHAHAAVTHDPATNLQALTQIYTCIAG